MALQGMPAHTSLGSEKAEAVSLQSGGYVRSLTGIHTDWPVKTATGPLVLADTVLRFEWRMVISDHFSAEAHQRIFQRIRGSTVEESSHAGLGTSVPPPRSLDLRLAYKNGDRLLLEHDVDRLTLRINLDSVNFLLGRQAITWGMSELFPVADLWAPKSPFDLDTSQKRGIDAIRVLFSCSKSWEIDAILADGGTLHDLSGGLRLTIYRSILDSYIAMAKQWQEMLVFAGATITLSNFKFRLEAAEPYNLDRHLFTLPQATLATDWIHSQFSLTLETHYNGTGVQQTSQYSSHLARSLALSHKKSYLLGRFYTGVAGKYILSELYQFTLSSILNLQDPSLLLATAFAWRLAQETELSVGIFHGIGKNSERGSPPSLSSEFGHFGSIFYLELASYF